jgi:hypothetical protein
MRMLRGLTHAFRVTALLSSLLAGWASASTHSVGVLDSGQFPICTATLGPSPASGTWSNNTSGSGHSTASATAVGGVLGAFSFATSTGTTVALNTNVACFQAEIIIDDIIISGPGDSASIQVSVDLDGVVQTSGLNTTNATANLFASIQLGENTGGGVVLHGSTLTQYNPGTFASNTNMAINTTLTTGSITLPTNTIVAVKLMLSGRTIASDNFGPGSAESTLDITDGMSFPTSGSVFTLPPGFTANSVDAGIVDNEFNPTTTGVMPSSRPQLSLTAYPNPFNPTTTISFTLPRNLRASVVVFDVQGRVVDVIEDRQFDAGLQSVVWDGTDSRGRLVSSGVYFYRLNADGKALTRRLVLLK